MSTMKKVILTVFTAILVAVSQLTASAAYDFPFSTNKMMDVVTTDITGNGTLSDPYIAKTPEHIKWAFGTGGYVKLGGNITTDKTVYVSAKQVHLDLAGYTYNAEFSEGGSAIYVQQSNALYITDSGSNGAIVSNGTAIITSVSAKLYVHGGRIAGNSKAVFAGAYSKINLYSGTLESSGATLYLNGATFCQYGGHVKTSSSDSSIECYKQYDSGNGVSSLTSTIILYGGEIDRLFIQRSSQMADAYIYDTTVYGSFGYEIKNGDATSIFEGDYTEICSQNLVNAISAAVSSGSSKSITVTDTVITVHQKKNVVPYVEIKNNITPVPDASLIYPRAEDGALYSFDSDWYDNLGQKLTSTYKKNEDSLNAYSFTVNGEASVKNSSKNMFLTKEIFLPNVDSRLYSGGISQVDESTVKYQINFPMQPFVTVQPKDLTDITAGSIVTFSTKALNASTYKWHLLDTDGNKVSWETAEQYGVIAAFEESQNTDTLKVKLLNAYTNGFGVYCEIYGNGGTVNTNTAKISLKKPVITVQPSNYRTVFTITAKNATKYEWRFLDENNYGYTWEQAKENGWGYPIDNSENTDTLYLLSIGKGLEGKKVYCIVSGYGYEVYSDTVTIGNFREITAHLNIDDLQIPFPGKEFSTSGAHVRDGVIGYRLESIKLVSGTDLVEETGPYIDFDSRKQYFYAAVIAPNPGYCFTANSIKSDININGYITGVDSKYKYTGTINRQLIDGKISVYLVPTFEGEGYRNTRPVSATAGESSISVKNPYDKMQLAVLGELGAPNYEYSLDNKNWYNLGVINGGAGPFAGLTPLTEYTVYIKNADTGNVFKTIDLKTTAQKGDVDENGKVQKADAEYLLKALSGTVPALSQSQQYAAKMTDDSDIDILDVIEIIKITA